MSDQNPSSSQGDNNNPNLRDIPRFNYKGLDSTTGRYNYKERFYSCRVSQSTQGLWSLSTSPSSSRSTSPTTPVPISVEVSHSILTPIVQSVFDISGILHNNSNTMEETDGVFAKQEDEVFDTTDEDEQWEVLEDELGDFLDENSSLPLNSDDIDKYIERLEEYRRGYKLLDRAIKKKVSVNYYATRYHQSLDQVLYKIKGCIKHAKDSKVKLRDHETKLVHNDRSLKERQLNEERLQHKQATDFSRLKSRG